VTDSDTTTQKKEIIYLTDPMCSWCWGFSPVLRSIREKYGDDVNVRLVVGGLRVGTKEEMNQEIKDFILHHWKEVQRSTGQDFNFEFNMPSGFKYDTEPSCRAVVAVRRLAPEKTFEYFHALQRTFYLDNKDITDAVVLGDEAEACGIDRERFDQYFDDPDLKTETLGDFMFSTNLGIRGFPSVVLLSGDEYRLLTIGYRSFEVLDERIAEWMQED
jgi:putative protein-disulfide isomerase